MNRINKLNRFKLVQELQSYEQYKYQTQKTINQQYPNIADLRKELFKLTTVVTDLPIDVLKEIMLNSDIKTIQQYCQTDKQANRLCYDLSFWNEKLIKENNIPILFNKDRPYEDIEDTIKEQAKDVYHTNNVNIVLYDFMRLAYRHAKLALLVNDIEHQRQFKPTLGTMTMFIDHEYSYYYTLPPIQLKKKHIIEMQIINNKLKIILSDLDNKETDYTIDVDVVKVITLYLFDQYTGRDEGNAIRDSNREEFYYNKDSINNGRINYVLKDTTYNTIIRLEQMGKVQL